MKRVVALGLAAGGVMGMLILVSPAPAHLAAGDPTLDAAISIIIQATRQEQDRRNAIEATAAAVSAHATQQAASVQATAAALSIQQTKTASEATRQARDLQATTEARQQAVAATQMAILAEGTRQATFATATSAAIHAEATRQAIDLQVQVESQLAALRVIGIALLFVLGVAVTVAAVRLLWRMAPRPAAQPIVVIESDNAQDDRPPTEDELPTPPETRVVYDQGAAQRIAEILEHQDQEP